MLIKLSFSNNCVNQMQNSQKFNMVFANLYGSSPAHHHKMHFHILFGETRLPCKTQICLETIISLHARTNLSYPGSNLTMLSFIFAVCWQVRHNRPCMPY